MGYVLSHKPLPCIQPMPHGLRCCPSSFAPYRRHGVCSHNYAVINLFKPTTPTSSLTSFGLPLVPPPPLSQVVLALKNWIEDPPPPPSPLLIHLKLRVC